MTINTELPSDWLELLHEEFQKEYFLNLNSFLMDQQKSYTIFPESNYIFNAFHMTAFKEIKVIILGQDPYHGVGQAHGLSFSVEADIKNPPSLLNIFKELEDDIGCHISKSGNLTPWATQGVFLLNTVLTVRENEANSHRGYGWEKFTDAVIKKISDEALHVVFILWGRPAQSKRSLIDSNRHLVLEAPHPSPLSSYRGFFGSKPFSKTNTYLESHGKKIINWCL
ncbi:MAG: uracil-DNA glycosylase [Campylobacterota bacterium]|nr:uracil-DNA glycosylase [Campylobacterota bacterium]